MKGIVFTKFIEMVEEKFSVDVADEMIEACDLPNGGAYTAVGTYDHQEMVTLLVQLSKMTGVSVPDLLRTYGKYLFGQFARLYPVFFEGITSSLDFAGQIDQVIHVEVLKLYPDAQLPRFETLSRSDDELTIVYRSDRHLGDLAEGLLDACIVHFNEGDSVRLRREDLQEPGNPVCFTMTRHR